MPAIIDKPKEKEHIEESLDTPWCVVVYDGPINLMSYVAMVFEKVLEIPRAKAEQHMLEVHTKGKSTVWSGGREKAEVLVQSLHIHLLQARLEKQ